MRKTLIQLTFAQRVLRLKRKLDLLSDIETEIILRKRSRICFYTSLALFMISLVATPDIIEGGESYWTNYSISLILGIASIIYLSRYGFYLIYRIKGVALRVAKNTRRNITRWGYPLSVLSGIISVAIYFNSKESTSLNTIPGCIHLMYLSFFIYFKWTSYKLKKAS